MSVKVYSQGSCFFQLHISQKTRRKVGIFDNYDMGMLDIVFKNLNQNSPSLLTAIKQVITKMNS